MSKIYSLGTAEFTASSGSRLEVRSDDSCEIYRKVSYTNHPDFWELLARTTAGVQYVSSAFTADTTIRINAGVAEVDYTHGTLTDVGAKNGATVSAVEYAGATIQKTVITLTATPVTIADDAGVAQYGGTAKIYDLPAGSIAFLGCIVDGDLTLGTTGTITATYAGGVSLGTVTATTGTTLTGAEADIMAEVDVAAATAKVATVAATSAGMTIVNGTSTAKDVFLNFVIDDDASHTAGTGTFTGTVTMLWTNVGDIA